MGAQHHEPGAEMYPWDQDPPNRLDHLVDCVGCGRTDALPGADLYDGTTPFWTWIDKNESQGLCSFCAAIPLDDLIEKIRIQQETILYADAMRRAATSR